MSEDTLKRITRMLSMTEMFVDLTPDQLHIVAGVCDILEYSGDETIFMENTASDEMYVIGKGGVEILVDPSFVSTEENLEWVVIAELMPGDVLGEMALVDQGLRSATARISVDDTVLLRIPRDRLMGICKDYPDMGFTIMHNLAADLALKIRNTDLTLRQYQLQLMYAKHAD